MAKLALILSIVAALTWMAGKGLDLFYQTGEEAKIVKYDKDLGWDFVGERGSLKFNDIGVRSQWSSRELAEFNGLKIVVLGSSVVTGRDLPLEDTFVSVAEKKLAAEVPVRIINAGFDGYEAYREFQKFQRDVLPTKPSLVVWYPTRNDFVSKKTVVEKVLEMQTVHELDKKGSKLKFDWLNRLSTDLMMAKRGRQYFLIGPPKVEVERNPERAPTEKAVDTQNLFYTNGLLEPLPSSTKQDFIDEVKRFASLLKSHEIELVVGFMPSFHFVESGKTWRDTKSYEELSLVLKEIGVGHFQHFDLFRSGGNDFSDYIHFSRSGHAKEGVALAQEIQRTATWNTHLESVKK